jgi:hypothetical protein
MKLWMYLFICVFSVLSGVSQSARAIETDSAASGASGFFGAAYLSNPNLSLILDTRVYSSNLNNLELEAKGIPGYTTEGLEMKKGFNLDSAELFFFSPVDPFFNLYAAMPLSLAGVELEEAYVVSTALPEGLQLKLGRFKSNITRLDAQHPHAWDFTDMALPYRAFLGSEGLGGENGAQVTYLPSLPVYILLGAEILQGENPLILGGDTWAGPQAFTGFIKASLDTSDLSALYFGPLVLVGQTKTHEVIPGAALTGRSTLSGLEAVWKWKPCAGMGLTWQSEYLVLHQEGKLADDAGMVGDVLRNQDGFYLQSVCQWYQFRVGARYDRLALAYDQLKINEEQQDLGDIPWRVSANCEYVPDEFTNIRLQYTYDASARNGQINREIILQFIFAIGAHPVHIF